VLGLRFKRDRYSNVPFIQVDKVVHHYTIEGADHAPALVFANSLGSDFSLVEDAAHISCVEQPEIFSRLLIKFLEEISSAS